MEHGNSREYKGQKGILYKNRADSYPFSLLVILSLYVIEIQVFVEIYAVFGFATPNELNVGNIMENPY